MKIDAKVFHCLEKLQWKIKGKCLLQNAFIVVHGWGNKLSFMLIPSFFLIVLIRCWYDAGIGAIQKVISFNWRL